MHTKNIKSIHAILPVIAKHFIDKKKKKKQILRMQKYSFK